MTRSRPPKVTELIETIRTCLDAGRYLDSRHVSDRQSERKISRPEMLFVLKTGFHEKRKDHYEERFRAWNYAIRGKTADKRELRVIVSFEEKTLVMITAIDLKERGQND